LIFLILTEPSDAQASDGFFIVVPSLLQIDVIAIKKAYPLIFYILIIYGGLQSSSQQGMAVV
jgi:hypothetical protein